MQPKGLLQLCFLNNAWMGYIQAHYIWVIDQVWGQDGWILVKFFFVSLWSETESRSITSLKKEQGQYPAIFTEQAWSVKD